VNTCKEAETGVMCSLFLVLIKRTSRWVFTSLLRQACEFLWSLARYDGVTDGLTLIVLTHSSVTLHQLSSDKPDQNKSPNVMRCRASTKREKWDLLRCSSLCHSKKEESVEIRSLVVNEVERGALLKLSCGKSQLKCLQSVARKKNMEHFSIKSVQ